MIKSMRFNPDRSPYCGNQVCGLIELIYDINYLCNNINLTCVEIGSHNGESSLLISSFPFIKKLYCVDIHVKDILYTRLAHKIASNNVYVANMSSIEFAKMINDESIDMVYIDGDHSYDNVLQDLRTYFPKVKKNGFITGHDYCSAHPEVLSAVEIFINQYSLSIHKTYTDSSFCIIKN